MHLLHFILLVLLGLLTPSMAAISRQVDGGLDTRNINQDLDRTTGKELADRGNLDNILLKYQLHCFPVPKQAKAPSAPGGKGPTFVKDSFCFQWIDCKPDGKEVQYNVVVLLAPPVLPNTEVLLIANNRSVDATGSKYQKKAPQRSGKWQKEKQALIDWCGKYCSCRLVDDPAKHPAENFGCVDPYGTVLQGMFGSVARDTDSAPPPSPGDKDGLVLEPFDGPARKE